MSDTTRSGGTPGAVEVPDEAGRPDREGEPAGRGPERGDEVDDVEADNAVEEDTIETIDPDNAPA